MASDSLFAPRWTRLEECQAAVARAQSTRAAWEALFEAQLLPDRWRTHPRRFGARALCGACDRGVHDGAPCSSCFTAPRLRVRPASIGACVRFAADVKGIERAEGFAREAARRFGASARSIVWRAVDPRTWRADAKVGADTEVSEWLEGAPLVGLDELAAAERDPGYVDALARGMDAAADSGAAAMRVRAIAGRDAWQRHSTRPNPFEPLVELMRLGYVLEAIRGELLFLGAPIRAAVRAEPERPAAPAPAPAVAPDWDELLRHFQLRGFERSYLDLQSGAVVSFVPDYLEVSLDSTLQHDNARSRRAVAAEPTRYREIVGPDPGVQASWRAKTYEQRLRRFQVALHAWFSEQNLTPSTAPPWATS